ncbi:hypothetical protein H4R33_005533 [Dimargaris cristalligena]|uniref:Protein-tyrosine phosphatase n=1 Tax=Dimargaris cristalligena TaxID=215637 RepID=A0A4P9ZWD8_9FUNG|nr:hypothetical protein H4R33_005533 [Dimargaris cristalligena]RKP37923.1 protein-tyrosine phosphatase [Dimargaris cristalligena]|eukprot:RKP37923.1 protein-tyrosine phosphatase [Dimargaris cristalligena]
MLVLSPPDAFGTVEEGIYRSSDAITSDHYPFLRNLRLCHIVFLSTEVPSRAIQKFAAEEKINLIHLGLKAWQANLGWKPVSEELVKEGLELILNRNNIPVLLMCTTGLHETGAFVGCLRKLQHWNYNSIIFEYRSFAGKRSRYYIEQFIELFDTDLITIPSEVPPFFTTQQVMWEAEDIQFLQQKWGSQFIKP